MTVEEISNELVTKLSSLEPNKVVTLSDEAGGLLLKIIEDMRGNGEI